jgi:aspartate aminotransferase
LNFRLHESVRGLSTSPTMAINERCERMALEGRPVYRLGLGQSPFPVPDPVVGELRAQATRKQYLPVRGLPALRAAVADYHHRRTGVPAVPDDVIIGPGSKELMFLLQVVCDAEVLVPSPAWVSYAPQARIMGREVSVIHARPQSGWRLDPGELDAWCRRATRPRILILNYPGNPSGTTYDAAQLAGIAEVARRHHVIVLSDEIYGELHFEGRHVSIATAYPEGTILASGLSKWCGAGGWRLGTFTFPRALRELLDAMAAVASETYTTTSAPIQYAAVRAFEGGAAIERYLWFARRILEALGRTLAARLRDAGAAVAEPEGGFYVFPDLAPRRADLAARGLTSAAAVAAALLEATGVAVLPGTDFNRPAGELTLRLAFVDFDGARAMAAAEAQGIDHAIDGAFLERYCGTVLEAAERLAGWLG